MFLKIKYSAFSMLLLLALSPAVFSQDAADQNSSTAFKENGTNLTSAEVMRERVSKAKALLAVKNYPAAVYELENIRRESSDETVHRVLNILLINAYLEQGDYKRAQNLLNEIGKSKSPDASLNFLAAAGQVVHGARVQAERYKALGLSVSDRNLPLEASADIENMRTTLELVIDQARSMTADKKLRPDAVVLFEESSSARGNIARDAYDAKRWKDQVTDAREQMIGSRSVIINATGNPREESKEVELVSKIEPAARKPETVTAAVDEKPKFKTLTIGPAEKIDKPPAAKNPEKPAASEVLPSVIEKGAAAEKSPDRPESNIAENAAKESASDGNVLPTDRPIRIIKSAERTPSDGETDNRDKPNVKSTLSEDEVAEKSPKSSAEKADPESADDDTPLNVGSLIAYATRRVSPVYPRQARNMRMTGVVTVEVVVDEDGRVAQVNETDGPPLLRRAASDAIRKWQFRPFKRDGQPVKATGFVSFNFDL